MKLTLVYSLLISFFVVLTPREIWHHCEDDHHVHSSHETQIEKDTCFACDFELTTASEPINYFFVFEHNKGSKNQCTKHSAFLAKKFKQFSHRGPPAA